MKFRYVLTSRLGDKRVFILHSWKWNLHGKAVNQRRSLYFPDFSLPHIIFWNWKAPDRCPWMCIPAEPFAWHTSRHFSIILDTAYKMSSRRGRMPNANKKSKWPPGKKWLHFPLLIGVMIVQYVFASLTVHFLSVVCSFEEESTREGNGTFDNLHDNLLRPSRQDLA